MTLPLAAYTNLTDDMPICRLLNGMWQVSGTHGIVDARQAIPDMLDYHNAGFTTWDLADHYGPAEDFIGTFRKQLVQQYGESEIDKSLAFTKWVPRPMNVTRPIVEEAINRSRFRMHAETIDLLQFHWWEYRDNHYLDALKILSDLRDEGMIRHLALTNFDTKHMKIIAQNGIRIVANQVQFSIIDRRPEVKMIPYCQQDNVHLLAYGTFCGGFLSENYLNSPEPTQLTTASQRKYKNMIDAWGGWTLFQELLQALKQIADKHQVSVANVAARYILDKPTVAGVIVGVRLGISQHRQDNTRVFEFSLDKEDLDNIHTITDQSRNLFDIIGDCGDEYRR